MANEMVSILRKLSNAFQDSAEEQIGQAEREQKENKYGNAKVSMGACRALLCAASAVRDVAKSVSVPSESAGDGHASLPDCVASLIRRLETIRETHPEIHLDDDIRFAQQALRDHDPLSSARLGV